MSDYYELTIACDGPRHGRGRGAIETVRRVKGRWIARSAEIPAVDEYRHPRDPDAPVWGSARWRRIGSVSGEGRRCYSCCGTTVALTEPVMLALLDRVAADGVSSITLTDLSVLASKGT